jgi:hypothetical protein
MGIKPSQNATVQTVEANTTLVVAGTINVTGALKIGGTTVSSTAAQIDAAVGGASNLTLAFSIAAGSANVSEVTITVKDGAGATVAAVYNLDVWLSDAATGAGLTGTTASGAVAAKAASGIDLVAYTAKKAIRVQTLATGVYILSITDTAKTGFYVCGQAPGTGKAVVSTQLVTGSYG